MVWYLLGRLNECIDVENEWQPTNIKWAWNKFSAELHTVVDEAQISNKAQRKQMK